MSLFCKVNFGFVRSFSGAISDEKMSAREDEAIFKRSPDGVIDEEIFLVARSCIFHTAI